MLRLCLGSFGQGSGLGNDMLSNVECQVPIQIHVQRCKARLGVKVVL